MDNSRRFSPSYLVWMTEAMEAALLSLFTSLESKSDEDDALLEAALPGKDADPEVDYCAAPLTS